MPTSIRSRSKINLGLTIGPSRPDGFHTLTTIYQTLALHDIVTVEARLARQTSIRVTSNHPRVPLDASNTAWRMVERALVSWGLAAEVRVDIDKRLPVQGGLGAGSANAAAALLALGYELGSELGPEREGRMPAPERLRLAAEVGSDVPLFLVGGAVVGVGRGEEVYPLPEMESLACVLALPDIGVSTPQAFRDWDARQAPPAAEQNAVNAVKDLAKGCGEEATALTPISRSATINMLSRSIAAAFSVPYSSGVFSQGEDRAETPLLALVRTGIENDFEQVVFSKYPLLGDVKRVLSGGSSPEERSVYAALSGSGSALFGLYRTEGAAQAALERLQAMGVPGVVTRTLTRDEYWRTMRV